MHLVSRVIFAVIALLHDYDIRTTSSLNPLCLLPTFNFLSSLSSLFLLLPIWESSLGSDEPTSSSNSLPFSSLSPSSTFKLTKWLTVQSRSSKRSRSLLLTYYIYYIFIIHYIYWYIFSWLNTKVKSTIRIRKSGKVFKKEMDLFLFVRF